MAISDYTNLLPQQADKATEDFFKVASTYSSNRDVLKALGAEDTQKKAGTGLLTSVFKVLGVPGNLIRAGILEATGNPIFNRFWTLLGNPCVHVPTGTGAHGMPLGVTVIGPLWADALTLSAAHSLELSLN